MVWPTSFLTIHKLGHFEGGFGLTIPSVSLHANTRRRPRDSPAEAGV